MSTMDSPSPSCRHPSRAVAVLAVLAVATGCATFGGGSEDEDAPPPPNFRDDPVQVQIQNNNWNTMHVYVVAGGQISSLGQVSSMDTGDFTVPAGMMGGRKEIRLFADPIGSRDSFYSDPILVEPGDHVEWTLQQPLVHSSVMVR